MYLFFLLLCFVVSQTFESCYPDNPSENCNTTVFSDARLIPSCSLVIPMDYAAYDSDASNLKGQSMENPKDTNVNTFNLRTYGLIVKLLYEDVPMIWSIRRRKGQYEPDFIKNVRLVLPASDNPNNETVQRSFYSGAFIVPVFYQDYARGVIEAWNAAEVAAGNMPIRVYELADDQSGIDLSVVGGTLLDYPEFLIPQRYYVSKKPYIAVFDSSKNARIQLDLMDSSGMIRDEDMNAAGDTVLFLNESTHAANASYRILRKEDAQSFDSGVCISMVTEPHFKGLDQSAGELPENFINAARGFVESGGNFLAQCGGIQTYSGCDIPEPTLLQSEACVNKTNYDTHFLTTAGLHVNADEAGPFDFVQPDMAVYQIDEPWVFTSGSVNVFELNPTGGAFLNTLQHRGYPGIENVAANTYMSIFGRTRFDAALGTNIYFLGGHDWWKDARIGYRVYMNAVLIPSERSGGTDGCGQLSVVCAENDCECLCANKIEPAPGSFCHQQALDTNIICCAWDVTPDQYCSGSGFAGRGRQNHLLQTVPGSLTQPGMAAHLNDFLLGKKVKLPEAAAPAVRAAADGLMPHGEWSFKVFDGVTAGAKCSCVDVFDACFVCAGEAVDQSFCPNATFTPTGAGAGGSDSVTTAAAAFTTLTTTASASTVAATNAATASAASSMAATASTVAATTAATSTFAATTFAASTTSAAAASNGGGTTAATTSSSSEIEMFFF